MITILEQLNALVPYFITLGFQLLCITSEKIEPGRALLVSLTLYSSGALPRTQIPRHWFCSYNKLNC